MPDESTRIVRLETNLIHTNDEIKRVSQEHSKSADNYERHLEENTSQITEIGKVLVGINIALESTRSTISDLKDTTKDLANTQNQMLQQMSLIDGQNKTMQGIQDEVTVLKNKVSSLEKLEAKLGGSWKAVCVFASIISFVVSMSFGFLKMYQTPPAPVPQHTPTAVELQVERLLQQNNSLKAK